MTPAQPDVAGYDYATFQADRAIMRFRGKKALPTEDGLLLKRQLLAVKASAAEMQAIDAAYARLMAWVHSGKPVPSEADDLAAFAELSQPERVTGEAAQAAHPETATGAEEGAAVAELAAAWAGELARQQARHARRRSKFEAVRP